MNKDPHICEILQTSFTETYIIYIVDESYTLSGSWWLVQGWYPNQNFILEVLYCPYCGEWLNKVVM